MPILIKHLELTYSDFTREAIARALAVSAPEAREAWPIVVREYLNAPMGRGIRGPGETKEYQLGVKDGLACALSAAVSDKTMPQFIALAKDSIHGTSRVLLLSAFRRSKKPLVMEALKELANDPDLEKEIASWCRKPSS